MFLVVCRCLGVLMGWAGRLLCTAAGMGGHLMLEYQKSAAAHPDYCANLWCATAEKSQITV